MKILVISGSPQPGSRTSAVASLATAVLRHSGAETTLWDLQRRPLPLFDPAFHDNPWTHPHPDVRELVSEADSADGFVLASPVYHNSYSGIIKNCLDHLSMDHFEYKPVGLIAYGGSMAAVQVCDHLRTVVRGLRGIALPTQVIAVGGDLAPGDNGRPHVAPALVQRLRQLAGELERFTVAAAERSPA